MDCDEDVIEEEFMAMDAIFMDSFSKIDSRKMRMVVEPQEDLGEDLKGWSIVLEMMLPDGYPDVIPSFDLSNPNNAAFTQSTREMIISGLNEEASGQVGEQMLYNLVEWLRENLPRFVEECRAATGPGHGGNASQNAEEEHEGPKETKKEKMSKAQKRRHYNRFGAVEEKPRGWNWVDILSHLAKKPS